MKFANLKYISAITASLLLVGCAGFNKAEKPAEPKPMTALEQELANASNSAAASLRSLALTERAIVGETTLDNIPAFDAEISKTDSLRAVKTIKYAGTIQNLVAKIAKDTGYTLSVIGKTPSVPVVVKVDVKGVQAVNILRDVSLQAGLRAKITLKHQEKTIEIAFAG